MIGTVMSTRSKTPVVVAGIVTFILATFMSGSHCCHLNSVIVGVPILILTPILCCLWTAKAQTTGRAWGRFVLAVVFTIATQIAYLTWLHSALFPRALLSRQALEEEAEWKRIREHSSPIVSSSTNETITGVVVEKHGVGKSSEAWDAPSDPYYVLEEEGGGITLRPSSSVSTEELSRLKGERVSLMGYHTEGEPYKPEEGEQYPWEPHLIKTTNGVADISHTPPTNRGVGFVVTRILQLAPKGEPPR
jgi:hypothetical protein